MARPSGRRSAGRSCRPRSRDRHRRDPRAVPRDRRGRSTAAPRRGDVRHLRSPGLHQRVHGDAGPDLQLRLGRRRSSTSSPRPGSSLMLIVLLAMNSVRDLASESIRADSGKYGHTSDESDGSIALERVADQARREAEAATGREAPPRSTSPGRRSGGHGHGTPGGARDRLQARGPVRALRRQAGGQARLDGHPRERDHRVDRPLGLRQEHPDPLPQPDERPDPARHRRGAVLYHGQDLYAPEVDPVEVRRRIGMVFQKPNPFPKSIFDNVAFGPAGARTARDMDECRAVAHARRLWDEVKDRLTERLGMSGRPAAASLHRALHRCRARRDPDGRALLGARPDLHREDRGPDAWS